MPGYLVNTIYNASSVNLTATGDVSATTLQAAIAELDTEKASTLQINSTNNNVSSIEALGMLGL